MATLDNLSETSGNLIAGDKVAGTNVYNNAGEKLGSVEDVMIDKRRGRIAYAVLSFGGFLGMGDKHYPLPWSTMTYDPDLGGYRVNLDKKMLEGAPAYSDDERINWEDNAWARRVHEYYKADPYWTV
jgi:sporulation protein YlmC with PRC-barrel domain